MRSNGPDGGFRLIALDDRNDFRPILILVSMILVFFFERNFYLAYFDNIEWI